ncbi:MAG: permease, partial [Rhizobiaceae bacterium]
MSIALASNNPGGLGWFAGHEARLFWRDLISMWTAGRPRRAMAGGVVLLLLVIGFHALAIWLLRPVAEGGFALDKSGLLAISGALAMLVSLMFSQSMESVTRAYYARQDLDLILSSPVPARRLFIVRSLVLTAQTILLSLLISGPVIHALVWLDGTHWLACYPLIIALGALATAASFGLTLILFRLAGPRKTRAIGQILSAVVGAGFVIALQGFAIILGKGYSRFALFLSDDSVAAMPALDRAVWLPARAAIGDPVALALMVIFGAAALAFAIKASSKRFADNVLLTSGLEKASKSQRQFTGFKVLS